MPRKGARSQCLVVLVPPFTLVCVSRGVRMNTRKGGLSRDSVSIGNSIFLMALRMGGGLQVRTFHIPHPMLMP